MSAESNRLRKAERCYRWLMLVYPKRFRGEFGEEMLQLFRAQWRESQLDRSALARFGFWLWLCADIGTAASCEHLSQIKERIGMRTKSRSILPGALTFLIAIVIGGATAPYAANMVLTPLAPRATVLFFGPMGGIEFGFLWIFGLGLIAALPSLISGWFHNRTRSLSGRTSFWVVVAVGCVCATGIGYLLVVEAIPLDTTRRVVTSRTLGMVFLIPAAMLLLAAISTAVIAARHPHKDRADSKQPCTSNEMKNNLQLLRSALSVAAGIVITVLISSFGELTIIGNGELTFEKLRLIWVPPVLAAVLGGYFTALIAPHSRVRHAMAVAGIFVLLIALLALRAAEAPMQTAMTSLALSVCILLGAIGGDWQIQRSTGYAA